MPPRRCCMPPRPPAQLQLGFMEVSPGPPCLSPNPQSCSATTSCRSSLANPSCPCSGEAAPQAFRPARARVRMAWNETCRCTRWQCLPWPDTPPAPAALTPPTPPPRSPLPARPPAQLDALGRLFVFCGVEPADDGLCLVAAARDERCARHRQQCSLKGRRSAAGSTGEHSLRRGALVQAWASTLRSPGGAAPHL